MRLLDRILLTLYTLMIIILSFTLLSLSLNFIPLKQALNVLAEIEYNWQFVVISFAISLIFLLISFRFLFSGIKSDKVQGALVKNTDLGMIRVSINTLDNLSQKAVRKFNEVKDVKSSILAELDGIEIRLKISVMPEIKIPDLTQAIQASVKEYVESMSGILVKEVEIYIDDFSTLQRSKIQ